MSSAGSVAKRRSPIDGWYQEHASRARVLQGMGIATEFHADVARGTSVRLIDLSWRRRFGCKGPGAEEWLAGQGLGVPAGANRYQETDGILVARLATSEFLVEGVRGAASRVDASREQLASPARPAAVYPVARHDFVIEVVGPALVPLLRQTCSVDFGPMLDAPEGTGGPVVYTSMVGVGVLALPRSAGSSLTLWTDPSFAHYFWTTLLEVAGDLGGGVGLDASPDDGGRA
jgi:sarcosine oxidase, subunit gamma